MAHRVEDLEVALRFFAGPNRDRLERPPHTLAFPSLRLRMSLLIEPFAFRGGDGEVWALKVRGK